MKTLIDQLSQYAAYHRDSRNIATHFSGIPMIVQAVAMLLARPELAVVGGVPISPATLVVLATVGYYLRLDVRYGLVMAALLGAALVAASKAAALSTGAWLGWGLGLFVVGWVFQFVGHFWEGRKPAFVDDLVGLIIGPLFVLAEAGFLLGLRNEVRAAVEARSGPVRRGGGTAAAAGG